MPRTPGLLPLRLPWSVLTLKNAKGKKLCSGFQTGACRSKWLAKQGAYDIICPHDKELRHQCNLSLSGEHPPSSCNGGTPAKKQKKGGKGAPAGNAWGKGAWGKGKGKGKISVVDDSGWAHVGPPQERIGHQGPSGQLPRLRSLLSYRRPSPQRPPRRLG